MIFFILFSFCSASPVLAQKKIRYVFQVLEGDTVLGAYIPTLTIFPALHFNNRKDRIHYLKMVRDVKITYPYANDVAKSIIETYEFMETLPSEKAKKEHLKQTQKFIKEKYKPKMKKLTKKQGIILVKLINRQTNSSAYNIVKALVGGFKANVYNSLAGFVGNNLKIEYDPAGNDRMIERIVTELEQGTL